MNNSIAREARNVNRAGAIQPDRYRASADPLRSRGDDVRNILLAPKSYLSSRRYAQVFDVPVPYEAFIDCMGNPGRARLPSAIRAEAPYEQVPNTWADRASRMQMGV